MYNDTKVYLVGTFYQDRACAYNMHIARNEHEAIEKTKNRQFLRPDFWFNQKYSDEDGKQKKQDIYKVYLDRELITSVSAPHPSEAANRVKQLLSYHILSIKRQDI